MRYFFTDQMGTVVALPSIPRRIVSLVPSQTELLYALGLDKEVVGITKFCVHPDSWRKNKTIIGGTKNFDFDTINDLQPDLIIGNKEENYEDGINELKDRYPVWMSDIESMQSAVDMIRMVGSLTDKIEKAGQLADEIELNFERYSPRSLGSALYLIWKKPWMAAGKNTFIDSMLVQAGFSNVLHESRYPVLSEKQIHALSPSIILLSSEPYPFTEKHIKELQQVSPLSKILLVDGEIFSWYGSRMLAAPSYFHSLALRA
jgi:ABC-type Fe3+-hydroxamate transport system substrate-binding protein